MAGSIEAYIRQAAIARGIDPNVAVRVARSEGGLSNPTQQSYVTKNGRRETSYGPFQLRIGGGLGDKALRAGIDPRQEGDWQKGVDFALNYAAKNGWGSWFGAGKVGLSKFAGITRDSRPVAVSTANAYAADAPRGTRAQQAAAALAAGRSGALRKGDTDAKTGGAVTRLQQQLAASGFDVGAVDGNYGARTAAAVRAAEKQYGLRQDRGVAGPQVQAALEQNAPRDVALPRQRPDPAGPGAGLSAGMVPIGGLLSGSPDFSIANPNPKQRLQAGAGVVTIPSGTGGAGRPVPTSTVGPDGNPVPVVGAGLSAAPPNYGAGWPAQPGAFAGGIGGGPPISINGPIKQGLAPINAADFLPNAPISPDPNMFGLDRRREERHGAASGQLQAAQARATHGGGPWGTSPFFNDPNHANGVTSWVGGSAAETDPGYNSQDLSQLYPRAGDMPPIGYGLRPEDHVGPGEQPAAPPSAQEDNLIRNIMQSAAAGNYNGGKYGPSVPAWARGTMGGAPSVPPVASAPAAAPDAFDRMGEGVAGINYDVMSAIRGLFGGDTPVAAKGGVPPAVSAPYSGYIPGGFSWQAQEKPPQQQSSLGGYPQYASASDELGGWRAPITPPSPAMGQPVYNVIGNSMGIPRDESTTNDPGMFSSLPDRFNAYGYHPTYPGINGPTEVASADPDWGQSRGGVPAGASLSHAVDPQPITPGGVGDVGGATRFDEAYNSEPDRRASFGAPSYANDPGALYSGAAVSAAAQQAQAGQALAAAQEQGQRYIQAAQTAARGGYGGGYRGPAGAGNYSTPGGGGVPYTGARSANWSIYTAPGSSVIGGSPYGVSWSPSGYTPESNTPYNNNIGQSVDQNGNKVTVGSYVDSKGRTQTYTY